MAKAGIDLEKIWYVVRTNIKCEVKAATNIRLAGFDHYLPRVREEKKHRRTNVVTVTERPLMPRYLFVGFKQNAKHFGFVRACEGVERLLEVDGTPVPVPAEAVEEIFLAEIDMCFDDTREARIHRKEEANSYKQTMAMRFPANKRVFISDPKSAFADLSAIVEEVTKSGSVRVLLELFGRLTPVEFEGRQLSAA